MTLEILNSFGDDILAKVFVAKTSDGSKIEFVESVQPPIPREQKWVLIVSTLKGCPIQCPICDAGGSYKGKLSAEEIHAQIDYLIENRFSGTIVPPKITKIQFARMGDPAFNKAVIEVLKELPNRYTINLMPSFSTVAPKGTDKYLKTLKTVKDELYSNGMFQMQFSVHTTCDEQRKTLVPAKTASLLEMNEMGEAFFESGDRKITLNFAAAKGFELDAQKIAAIFDPKKYIVKLTPINPTQSSVASNLEGFITDENDEAKTVCQQFNDVGFDTILSIGENRENQIGSNCGMYVAKTI